MCGNLYAYLHLNVLYLPLIFNSKCRTVSSEPVGVCLELSCCFSFSVNNIDVISKPNVPIRVNDHGFLVWLPSKIFFTIELTVPLSRDFCMCVCEHALLNKSVLLALKRPKCENKVQAKLITKS